MAKMKLFSIYDSKVAAHMHLFCQGHSGQAVRGFQEAVNNPETMLAKHPADFTLFELAEIDQETGEVTAHPKAVNLGQASNFVKPAAQQIPMPFERNRPAPAKAAEA